MGRNRPRARRTPRLSAVVGLAIVLAAPATPAAASPGRGSHSPRPHAPTPHVRVDFNGDGYADLAEASAYEDVGTATDAGAAQVLYGSGGGLQGRAPAGQYWTQDSPGVQDQVEAGDQFGWDIGTGDFNGDGYTDLAIGVPKEDVDNGTGTVVDAGAVQVLYGGPAGLQTDSPAAQFWTQESPGVTDQAEVDDAFGRALASGDFNHDGFADLAVDIRREDVGSISGAGAVAVLYGGTGGLQADAPDDQLWTQDSPGVQDQAESGDWFGRAVATGDFNGDGFDDLAAGAPFEDLGTVKDAGAVGVLSGSPSGLQADAPDDQFWTQDSPGVKDRGEGGDLFGRSLSAGDYNGDGFDDMAIGVRHEAVGSVSQAGAVGVLYGSASGLQANAPDDQFWTQNSPGLGEVAERGDQFGYNVGSADYNGDGFADLAIGVQYEDLGAVANAGEADLVYGSAAGLETTSPPTQVWTQDSPGVQDTAEAGDFFGSDEAGDDFNADGYADLALGDQGEDVGPASGAGAVEVLYGTAGGVQAGAPPAQFWNQDSPGVDDPPGHRDYFGWRVI